MTRFTVGKGILNPLSIKAFDLSSLDFDELVLLLYLFADLMSLVYLL